MKSFFINKYPKLKKLITKYYKIEPNLIRFLEQYDSVDLLTELDIISKNYKDIINRQTDPPAFYFDRIEIAIKDYLKTNSNSILKRFIQIRDLDIKICFPHLFKNNINNN